MMLALAAEYDEYRENAAKVKLIPATSEAYYGNGYQDVQNRVPKIENTKSRSRLGAVGFDAGSAAAHLRRLPRPRRRRPRPDNDLSECGPITMRRASASRRSYTRAIFRTHAHLADEAAGILVAAGAIGCAVAGMKLPRAREQKTVALEAYFDAISANELSRLKLSLEQAGMLADGASRRGRAKNRRSRMVHSLDETLRPVSRRPSNPDRPAVEARERARPHHHRSPAGASFRHRTPSHYGRHSARAGIYRHRARAEVCSRCRHGLRRPGYRRRAAGSTAPPKWSQSISIRLPWKTRAPMPA